MNLNKIVKNIFFILVCLSVSSALWVFKDLLFPFVTSKAFFFRIAIELALPFYLYLIVSEKELRPSIKNPLSLLVVLFLIINTAASFTGNSTIRSLWGNFERMGGAYYIAHLSALYFYVLALGQMQKQYLQIFLKFLLFFAFIVAGNGIFGWLGLPTFVVDPSLPTRVSSTLGNPIYLGSFLIIPLFISLFMSFQAEGKGSKAMYWILAFVFLFGIFLSGTRGAAVGLILGVFISAVFYLALSSSNKIRIYGVAAILFFVASVGVLFIFSKHLPNGSILQRLVRLKDGNSDARLLQWKVALEGYKERPLLGTGPENYYVVANKYYNSEIYKHDRSWFDKPHNYILEILVTSGVFGFVVYLGILVYMVYSLYSAYKAEFFGLVELCILLSAFFAYQIQNLFVFDTVPASLTFYSFLGFVGYLWHLSKGGAEIFKANPKNYKNTLQAFPFSVLLISGLVMSYAIYATNVVPLQISKNINYGYAYINVDPYKASSYFDVATSLPFNFDKTETASKYADFASNIARSSTEKTRELAYQTLDKAIVYTQHAIETQPDNPILWQRLVTLYLFRGVQVDGRLAIDPRAEEAVQKAVALAPNREESYLNRAQILGVKGDMEGAIKVLLETQKVFPTDTNLYAQLANYYKMAGNQEKAISYSELALESGYSFNSYNDVRWLVLYYQESQKYNKALAILEKAQKSEPGNIQVFVDSANLYFRIGRVVEAQALAKQIINFDSKKSQELQAIVDSYSQVATTTP